MKNITTLITLFMLCAAALFAQAPEKFSYQAVVRNANNILVSNAQVGVRVNILQGTDTGGAVYSESHVVNSNANGLITINIGGGSVLYGSFEGIDWSDGPFFLKTDIDPSGGNDYTITSTQQLLSVPYALYSKEAGNVPVIPTNVSAFINDAGYLTSFTIGESDTTGMAALLAQVQQLQRPSVSTLSVDNVSYHGAYVTGRLFNSGIYWISDCGFCWSTAQNPTLVNNHLTAASDLGTFGLNLTGLDAGTTYYVRAYATNSAGTTYGEQLSFTTTSAILPTVTTDTVSNITASTATCGGNVTFDGGATVTVRGVCWSISQNPTVSDNHTTDGSGTGSFTSIINGLTTNTTYYVRAYATNSLGTAYGEQLSFTTAYINPDDGQPCPGIPTVTDHEGNVYNTVKIGDQCWMKENLRTVTSPSTGTYLIPAANVGYTETGKQARWYNNDSATYAPMNYGLLYNWNAAMDTFNTAYGETSVNVGYNSAVVVTFTGHRRGICPVGWHVPSGAEWSDLANYVGSVSEYQCGGNSWEIDKALASEIGWNSCSGDCYPGDQSVTANNATGFSAVPAGYYGGGLGDYAIFWTTDVYGGCSDCYDSAFCRSLKNCDVPWYPGNVSKYDQFSVRCLRDSNGGGGSSVTLPTVTTSMVSNITATTATCGGNVTADGGSSVTARGVCWSTSQNPTVSGNLTTDGSGMGSFTSSITGLIPNNTTYYVRAYATNGVYTAYGNEFSFTTASVSSAQDGQPCSGTPTVTDHEGNVYNTVQVGDQCWMRENLRTTHFADGSTIPAGGSNTSSNEPYYYNYSSSGIPLSERGYLYNWPAAMHGAVSSSAIPSGVQGICPTGWHLPSDAEWTILKNYMISVPDYQCGGSLYNITKALASTTGWNTSTNNCATGNNQSVNNATGFSAVPAGYFGSSFNYSGRRACFWSSTESEYGSSYAYLRYLDYNYASVSSYTNPKSYGYSVRCLRD